MTAQPSHIPKYHQISLDIIDLIQRGTLLPGSRTPSENEIIDTYRVSNTTARKVLKELEHAGWVTRVKGKGTFVRHKKIERSASRILGFTKNMIEEGRNPSTKLVSIHVNEPAFTLVIQNREYTLSGPVCKIQRLRLGDDEPVMFETRYISIRFCPEIYKKDLERSLYEIYENDYRLQLDEIHQTLSAIMLDEGLLRFFNVRHPIPAFKVEGVTMCGKGMILEMEESIYRGDLYRFSVTAKRSES